MNINSNEYYSPDREKRKYRNFIIATAISAILHAVFLLRGEAPFDQLMRFREHPSLVEWVGLLFLLYVVPPAIFFLLTPVDELPYTSGDRTTAIALFAGCALILGFLGILSGGVVGFLVGIMFFGIK